ncbi:lipase family protein [Phytohabitans sp. LJ34]|uniref:lipase family protein n=1 Tax=Phytohabitans sp. LJ34 TaxID=3452217 RepID=UPI003F8B93DE
MRTSAVVKPIVKWIAAALAAAVLAAAPVTPAAQAGGGHHHRPGRPVFAEPLPASLWLPGTAAAHRIRYTSTGFAGRPVVVAGAVFVPEGTAPKRGWPVISWAHGTVGVADPCAQSVGGRSARDVTYLSAWLAAGYAVVATEYEGLGTPGPHPYLHGRSEAYGVVDMVRAARTVERSLSRTWLAVGQSQGGQAVLFTGAMAHRYAPELDYRGAIATAPPSQWRTLIEVARPFEPAAPAIPNVLLALEMLGATHPRTFDPASHLTPAGAEVFARARTEICFTALSQLLAGRTAAEVYAVDAAERERLTRLMEREADIPIVRHREPVFIAQGTADTVVYPPASKTTADKLAAAGSHVTFRFYPGADHSGAMSAALPELLTWAAARVGK